MSAARLAEAMRFGADTGQHGRSLSKFGMGMKLAALSIARELRVVSLKNGEMSGRGWSVEGIEAGWKCDVLTARKMRPFIDEDWGAVSLERHGTVVVWSDIDRIEQKQDNIEATVDSLKKKLRFHLGLHFHRFLEDGRVAMYVDSQKDGEEPDAALDVTAINPFGYDESGAPDYPRHYAAAVPGIGNLALQAHIWPANATSKQYRLDGRTAQRQGFYFYRNDRLIQAGGWNDLRDLEPHYSLARVAVDLPPEMDNAFALDIQKASLQLPPAFGPALRSAEDPTGEKWNTYLRAAKKSCSRAEKRNPSNYPQVPGNGLPRPLRSKLRELLAGSARVREVDFEWGEVPEGEFFLIDKEEGKVVLNVRLRSALLEGKRASATDLPMLKTLLFLLLQDVVDGDKMGKRQREKVELVNTMLMETLKSMRRG